MKEVERMAKILACKLKPSTLAAIALVLEEDLLEEPETETMFWDTVSFLIEALDIAHLDSCGEHIRLKQLLN